MFFDRDYDREPCGYDVMQVCLKGDKITDTARSSPEFCVDRCPKCGSPTTTQCGECKEPIRGRYVSAAVADFTPGPSPPNCCHKCGTPFPWAKAEEDTMAKARGPRTLGSTSEEETRLVISRSEANVAIAKRVALGEELLGGSPADATAFETLAQKKRIWHEYNVQMVGRFFSTRDEAERYARTATRGSLAPGQSISQRTATLHNNIRSYITSLRSLQNRLPQFSEARNMSEPGPGDSGAPASLDRVVTREVFIVHGRNEAVKESVARFLESLDLRPIILHEKPNLGRTLIEKFEAHSDVAYAVILLTGDDLGGERTKIETCLQTGGDADSLRRSVRAAVESRARQNVVLEFGAFIGKLGRRNVCALYEQGVELPSDIDGLAYVPLDAGGAWRLLLAREIRAAGIEIDLNRVV